MNFTINANISGSTRLLIVKCSMVVLLLQVATIQHNSKSKHRLALASLDVLTSQHSYATGEIRVYKETLLIYSIL